jgi:hypothetical protein
MVVIEPSVLHSQGLKNVRGGKLSERFVGGTLHDYAQQKIVSIAVNEFFSGNIVEILLPHDEIERFLRGMQVRIVPAGKIEQGQENRESESMVAG